MNIRLELAGIIYRKKGGTDCTEDESATIKTFLKDDIEAYKRDYNDLSTIYGILWELFPAECSEAVEESEMANQ